MIVSIVERTSTTKKINIPIVFSIKHERTLRFIQYNWKTTTVTSHIGFKFIKQFHCQFHKIPVKQSVLRQHFYLVSAIDPDRFFHSDLMESSIILPIVLGSYVSANDELNIFLARFD